MHCTDTDTVTVVILLTLSTRSHCIPQLLKSKVPLHACLILLSAPMHPSVRHCLVEAAIHLSVQSSARFLSVLECSRSALQ